MPMNFSGRSVEAASRVIEIDEELVATIASGFSTAQTSWKILRLTSSFSTAVSITRSQSDKPVDGLGRGDAVQRLLARVLGDDLLDDLARQIAVDGRHRRFQPVGGDIVEHHVQAGQRRHMGDAIAHLARADHADLLDCHRHLVIHPNGAHIAPVHPVKPRSEPRLKPVFDAFSSREPVSTSLENAVPEI